MKTDNSPKASAGKSFLTASIFATLVTVSGFSSNANAFTDGAALKQRIIIMIKEIKEYQKQLQLAKDQLNQYMTPLSDLKFEPTIGDDEMFKERGPEEGMKMECPGAGPIEGGFDALKSVLSLDAEGSVKDRQKKLCQYTVLARNQQYNESVRMLKGVREREKELQEIQRERNAIKPSDKDAAARLESNTNRYNAVINKASNQMQYSTATIQAYESYINSLEQHQAVLGNAAMTGKTGNETFASTITKTVVQGVALEAALKTASRER
jgi:hypothetical protein